MVLASTGVCIAQPPAPMVAEVLAARPVVLVALATSTLTLLCGTVVVVVVAPLWPWLECVVVVVGFVVVVVVAPAAAPPAAVVVVPPGRVVVVDGVVGGAPTTLGRVPTPTRIRVATTKKTRTKAAAQGREGT